MEAVFKRFVEDLHIAKGLRLETKRRKVADLCNCPRAKR